MNERNKITWFYNSINQHLSFVNDVDLNADGDATIKLINQTIKKYAHSDFIKNCVKAIDEVASDMYGFCKALFDISCKLVDYRMDPPGHEIVFTPQLLIRVRQGDCKKFTTFICAVLECKGIPCADKVVNYDEPFRWQHIYAIAFYPNDKGYIVLDPVNHKMFDKEVTHRIGRINYLDGTYSKLTMAKLSIMGNVPGEQKFFGIGEASDDLLGDLEEISGRRRRFNRHSIHGTEQEYINGVYDDIEGGPDEDESMAGLDDIGKKKAVQAVKAAVKKVTATRPPEKKAAAKEKRKKIAKGAKKVGYAPVRAAFLVLLGAGGLLAQHTPLKFNLALKLAQLWNKDADSKKKLLDIWQKFGGKPDALKNAIVKASKTQLSGGIYGIGDVNAGVIIAAVTAAAPILVLVIKLLYQKSVMKKEEAALSVDLVEKIEDNATTDNGDIKPEVMQQVKTSLPAVQEAVKLDDGGDKAAQQTIKQTVTPNDQMVTAPATTYTTPVQNSSDGGGRTMAPQDDQTATPTNTHAGFMLLNASSWLTGSVQVQLMFGQYAPTLSAITGAGMLAVSIYLFTKKSIFKF